jgi:hypothetical protein
MWGMPLVGQQLTAEQAAEDFAIFRRALEQGHPGLYKFTPKPEMDRLFDETATHLAKPMDVNEFYRLLLTVTSAVKCGHTDFKPPAYEIEEARKSHFPLRVRDLDGRLWIYRDYATATAALEGGEIVSINGIPSGNILMGMLAAIPGDGNSTTVRPHRIDDLQDDWFGILLFPLFGIHAPFDISYRSAAGKLEKMHLEGKPYGEIQKMEAAKHPDKRSIFHVADLEFLNEGDVAVLRVYGFGGFVTSGDKKVPLGDFIDETFRQLTSRHTKSLILDLRDNGGGKHELAEQIFSYLEDKPFLYYKDILLDGYTFDFLPYTADEKAMPLDLLKLEVDGKYHYVKQANWGIQQPKAPHFDGKVFVLENGGSFSTTCEFLSLAHFHKRGVFIGEESAGNYYGNTSGEKYGLTLPNSKLFLLVPTASYQLAVSGQPLDRGILPDYPVRYSIEDMLKGKDKEMDLALELAHR